MERPISEGDQSALRYWKNAERFIAIIQWFFWMRVMSKIGRWLTDVVPEKWRGTANIDHQATVLRERNRMKTTVSRVKVEKKMEAK